MREYPVKLGSILFTMVEPHKGHEVEYNRWYERDHFYAGCMIGANNFAGNRYVATRDLKALRYPSESPITPAPETGSYVAIYWILDGAHDEWNKWAVKQVRWLHANGRMFAERDHIHTLLYKYAFPVSQDADGVPPELALDHRYAGIVSVMTDATGDRDAYGAWLRDEFLPGFLAKLPGSQVLTFTPLPLLGDAPGDVPRTENDDQRYLHLFFLEQDPREVWDATFASLGKDLAESGQGSLVWAGPFIETVKGTDTYTDQLW